MRILVLFIVLVLATKPALAEDSSAGSGGSVQDWVERLESPRFSIRNAAMSELMRRGLSAIEIVEEIASRGDAESSDRAFEIIKRHFKSEDVLLQQAAAEVLQRISEQPEHRKANLAEEVLNPPPPPSRIRLPRLFVPPQRVPRLAPGLPLQAQQGGVRRITIRSVNGKKEISVRENGKEIRVTELPNGIRVIRSEGPGKSKTKLYRNLKEMSEDDPEASKHFGQAGGGMQFRMDGRIQFGFPRGIPGPRPQQAQNQLEEQLKKIREEASKRREALQKQQEELERQRAAPSDAIDV